MILQEKLPYFENVYFITGTAYAGKSTMVKMLAEKYHGILCEENYHDVLLPELDKAEFPCLTYTRDLENWSDFIRRTPDQYAAWIAGCEKECTVLELKLLKELSWQEKKVFVDTNISLDVLRQITDHDHVLIMLTDPTISVNRFFDRPDKEKQFLYQLLMKESDPEAALKNFRECLKRINSQEAYERFLHAGFNTFLRDDGLSLEETLTCVEKLLKLL